MTLYARTTGDQLTRTDVHRETTLNAVVDFDSPFRVLDDGMVESYDVDAPSSPNVEHDPAGDIIISDDDWTALTGWTGQHGYRGAVLHPSEVLAGRLAEHVLDTPGVYVVTEVRDESGDFPDGDPVGWSILRYAPASVTA